MSDFIYTGIDTRIAKSKVKAHYLDGSDASNDIESTIGDDGRVYVKNMSNSLDIVIDKVEIYID